MADIFVAGLINIETSLKIKEFPIEYFPIDYPFFGINSGIAGVAFNIASALDTLGDKFRIASLISNDEESERILKVFNKNSWDKSYLINQLSGTPQSIILYDQTGRRQIYCDLKDIQENSYPHDNLLEEALGDSKVAIICNINFARPLLKMAKDKNVLIASDMHVLSDINDEYNKEFMEHADILFLSDEKLPCLPEKFIKDLKEKYPSQIIVLGRGSKGAMMYIREEDAIYTIDAVKTREVINTVGAGDALFCSFIHFYVKGKSPIEALKRAEIFASYKIGANVASKGFLDEQGIEAFYKQLDFSIERVSC